MPTLDKLVQLPCTCGRDCGRTAATIVVRQLDSSVQDMVRSGINMLRLAGGKELRAKMPPIPDDENPLAHIPVEMIAGALGLVHPECVAAELSNGHTQA